jgi:hypothetical protein
LNLEGVERLARDGDDGKVLHVEANPANVTSDSFTSFSSLGALCRSPSRLVKPPSVTDVDEVFGSDRCPARRTLPCIGLPAFKRDNAGGGCL